MQWVKHDTDANQDAKLQSVLLDYGLEGYGLYWYCIELIAGKVGKDNITFELEHDARIIARNTGSTVQKVEEMMKYFVSLGLFESSGGVVTCLKLARRLDQSMTSNPEMRKIINSFKEQQFAEKKIKKGVESHDSVMMSPDSVMQHKIRLDKNIKTYTSKPKHPVCPHEEIINIYNETLPQLQSVLVNRWKGSTRARDLTSRWKEDSNCQTLDFWKTFFQNIAKVRQGFYVGEKGWKCDLGWLLKKTNFDNALERMIAEGLM